MAKVTRYKPTSLVVADRRDGKVEKAKKEILLAIEGLKYMSEDWYSHLINARNILTGEG